jgi:hypothetical protein
MPKGALQQRAMQQLAGDRQLGDKFVAGLEGRSRIIHQNESMATEQVKC